MTVLEAILLGLLQGLTEFLPVSSSGHLALAEHFFAISSPGVTFEVFLHFGTALAVLWFFRSRVGSILRAVFGWISRGEYDRGEARLALYLMIGTIPAAVIGLAFSDMVGRFFDSPMLVSVMLLVTGGILWLTKRLEVGERKRESMGDAILIGLAQAGAILPGISRSGATISAGLGLGLDRRRAAEFAFLLSIPVILGATAASAGEAFAAGSYMGWTTFAGTVAAFVSAIPAIAVLRRLVTVGVFHRFAYYCWAVGTLGLVLSATLG
ncbi:undecaprenyl-diphosphate phosphatase [bacterium]|nr:undecaprenyl-diphosphate phosphatase [bacterium]